MDLSGLNEEQRNVVTTTEGPMMVLAGAGSGKTRALTHKVAYLIEEKGILPWEILAITFTNKAANEMKERIVKLSNKEEKYFNVFTFHSFCSRLIRTEHEAIGRSSSFSIYDDSESIAVIKSIIKAKNLDPDEFNFKNIQHYISRLKDYCHYVGQIADDIDSELEIDHEFYPIFIAYEEELKKSNAIDFGGLITSSVEILKNNPVILKKYQTKYKYVLVDEFQDTNKSQFELTKLLVGFHNNITVIGDDFQSIYRFRNADIKNFLDFDKSFPDVKFVKLEENYRSTKIIVKAANSIILNNKFQKEKNLFTSNPEGSKIKLISCFSQINEAEYIGSTVRTLLNQGKIEPNEISILFRNNAQSRTIEEALRKLRIPYILTGGMKFYERKEIKDVISLMRLIINENDSSAVLRMLNNPARGIGKKTIDSFVEQSLNSGKTLFSLLENNPKGIKVSKKAKEGIDQFVGAIRKSQIVYNSTGKLTDLYKSLMTETKYVDILSQSVKHEDVARIDNLKEFYGSLMQVDSESTPLVNFLENISLAIDQDDSVAKEDCVNLMTVHSSKGLEFKYVFILGLEESLFPSKRALEEDDAMFGIEEERRLFYVAVTRCKKQLYITVCQSRFLYGMKHNNPPSRFLREIPSELFDVIKI